MAIATEQAPNATMQQPQPTAMEYLQQAHAMETMEMDFRNRAQTTGRELATLNSGLNTAPKPGGLVKTAAIASVSGAVAHKVASKVVDEAGKFRNANLINQAGDSAKSFLDNALTKAPNAAELDLNALQKAASKQISDGSVRKQVMDTLDAVKEVAHQEGVNKVGDLAGNQGVSRVIESGKQAIDQNVTNKTTKGIGYVVDAIKTNSDNHGQYLGTVRNVVIGTAAVGGMVLGANHMMKENAGRQARLNDINAQIEAKKSEGAAWDGRADQAASLAGQYQRSADYLKANGANDIVDFNRPGGQGAYTNSVTPEESAAMERALAERSVQGRFTQKALAPAQPQPAMTQEGELVRT